ncbi:MAG TPA: type II toxin-antitoxin system YafQ family toxin [Rhizomicrobium sp.]|jgi:mRNA interferase YafQ|nr:type II toxin-antitoxin system YafQ family toxin [Rhizomicrobium sp.]
MRAIERTTQFKRDYKREAGGRHRATLDENLTAVLRLLVSDRPCLQDIATIRSEWDGYRDCHARPDLVLIYEKLDADTLRLIRLGSHSELGL